MSLLKAIVSVALVSALFSGRAENAFTAPGENKAYAANTGWVHFHPDGANSVFINAYFLGGKAYLANAGWLDFGDGSPASGLAYANDSDADYGVNRDGAGNLSGYAYGANVGWVNFGWAQPNDPNRPRVDFSFGTFAGYVYSANLGWINLAAFSIRYDTLTYNDLDEDGMTDFMEINHFASPRVADATSDYDGDGFSDQTELTDLTDPLDYDDPAPANPSTIVAGENFAYGANSGWMNFRPSLRDGVIVREKFLSGSVYMANAGWVSLGDGSPVSAVGYANNIDTDYGVNRDAAGNLSGLGYGANIGWINFGWAQANDPNRPRLNPLTGVFSGYAYAANLGWIDLGTNLRHLTPFGRDDDNDGLPDSWENNYFGNLTTTDGSGDYDQDGFSEAVEYANETSPIDQDDPEPDDPSNVRGSGHYAYGANVSWLDFRPSARHGVIVGTKFLSRNIYGPNIGWISVGDGSPANGLQYANDATGDFGVNVNAGGNLSGYGYSANAGWVNFGWAASNDPNRPRVNLTSGLISGYAYGANIGWINLGTGTLSITDPSLPTVKVLAPVGNRAYVGSATLPIAGTVKDNELVSAVKYSLNDGPMQDATLSYVGNLKASNWTANITMLPGTNTLSVIAIDGANNTSAPPVKVKFFYHVPSSFTLQTNGVGKIDAVSAGLLGTTTNGATLFVGRTYFINASVVSNDWLLTNITYTAAGGASGTLFTNIGTLPKYKLGFTMKPEMVITANFITNPLVQFGGIYNGLFHEADEVRHHSAGFFKMNVTRKFGVSGNLLLDGNSISFSGKMNIDGSLNKVISRAKLNKSDLHLSTVLGFTNGGSAYGTVSGTSLLGENFTSILESDRTVWATNVGQQALQFTNRYTMAITGLTSSVEGPEGFGYALVDLTSVKGQITVSGELSDSYKMKVPIKQTTFVATNGLWPFFSAMYPTTNRAVTNLVRGILTTTYPKENRGIVMGWLRFETNSGIGSTNLAPLGLIDWVKTGWTNGSWNGGFTNQVWVNSSRHLPPETGTTNRIYNFTNAWVEISGGKLSGAFSNVVNLKTNNTFQFLVPATRKFTARLTSKTGLISGTFTNGTASGTTNIDWKGVLLQDQNHGLGFFNDHTPHTNSSGKVVLTPKD